MYRFLSLILLPLFFISSLSLQALAPTSSTPNPSFFTPPTRNSSSSQLFDENEGEPVFEKGGFYEGPTTSLDPSPQRSFTPSLAPHDRANYHSETYIINYKKTTVRWARLLYLTIFLAILTLPVYGYLIYFFSTAPSAITVEVTNSHNDTICQTLTFNSSDKPDVLKVALENNDYVLQSDTLKHSIPFASSQYFYTLDALSNNEPQPLLIRSFNAPIDFSNDFSISGSTLTANSSFQVYLNQQWIDATLQENGLYSLPLDQNISIPNDSLPQLTTDGFSTSITNVHPTALSFELFEFAAPLVVSILTTIGIFLIVRKLVKRYKNNPSLHTYGSVDKKTTLSPFKIGLLVVIFIIVMFLGAAFFSGYFIHEATVTPYILDVKIDFGDYSQTVPVESFNKTTSFDIVSKYSEESHADIYFLYSSKLDRTISFDSDYFLHSVDLFYEDQFMNQITVQSSLPNISFDVDISQKGSYNLSSVNNFSVLIDNQWVDATPIPDNQGYTISVPEDSIQLESASISIENQELTTQGINISMEQADSQPSRTYYLVGSIIPVVMTVTGLTSIPWAKRFFHEAYKKRKNKTVYSAGPPLAGIPRWSENPVAEDPHTSNLPSQADNQRKIFLATYVDYPYLQQKFSVFDLQTCTRLDAVAFAFTDQLNSICRYLDDFHIKSALNDNTLWNATNKEEAIIEELTTACETPISKRFDLGRLPKEQLSILTRILIHSLEADDLYQFFLANCSKDDFADHVYTSLPDDMNSYSDSNSSFYSQRILRFTPQEAAMPLFRSVILPATYHPDSIATGQYTPIPVDQEQLDAFAADLTQYAQNTLRPRLAPLYPTTATVNKTVTIQPVKELRYNEKLVLATNQPQADGSINIKVSYAFCQLYSSLKVKNPHAAETFKLFILANELHQALHQISTQSQATPAPLSDDEIEYLSMLASLQTLCSIQPLQGQTLNPTTLIIILRNLLDDSLVPIHCGQSSQLSTNELQLVTHIENHLGIIHQHQLQTPCSLLNVKALCTKESSDSLATAVHLTSIVLSSS